MIINHLERGLSVHKASKKYGFTLLELLAVLIILTTLVLIAVPLFSNKSDTSKQIAHNETVAMLLKQGQTYLLEQSVMPLDNEDIMDDLISQGYIKERPINPIYPTEPTKQYKVIYKEAIKSVVVEPGPVEVTVTSNGGSGGSGGSGGTGDAPTATVTYDIVTPTSLNVIATIHPSESVSVTNNGGSTSYTFTANGSFTFQFRDADGNTGSVVATVSNIDKSLIDLSVYSNVIYVKATGGNDTSGNGSDTNPYATIIKALSVVDHNQAIYLYDGTYTINSFADFTKNKQYDIIGNEKNTTIVVNNGISIYDENSTYKRRFIRIIFKASETFGGYTDTLAYWSNTAVPNIDFYNCVFKKSNSNYPLSGLIFWGANSGGNTVDKKSNFYNCVIDTNSTVALDSCGTNIKFINCVTTGSSIMYNTANLITSLTGELIDSNYSITSSSWQNIGTGTDKDGSQADIGVYGGTYAWKPAPSPTLVYVDGLGLGYDKVLYVNAASGNDTTGDGTDAKPYATLLKAISIVDYNQAIYLYEGTYTINSFADLTRNKKYDIIGRRKDTTIIVNNGSANYVESSAYKRRIFRVIFKPSDSFGGYTSTLAYWNNGSVPNLDFYNCVFKKSDSGTYPVSGLAYWGNNAYGTDKKTNFYNCIIDVNAALNLDELGIGIKFINCATKNNNTMYTTSNFITSLKNVSYDSSYNITSAGWQNVGTGIDGDDSTQADIGVYGGSYSWRKN